MRGADLVEATQCYHVREIRYAFNAPFIKNCGGFDIGLSETRSGRDRALSFKVGDNQRPERSMSGVENLCLSVPSPVKTDPGK